MKAEQFISVIIVGILFLSAILFTGGTGFGATLVKGVCAIGLYCVGVVACKMEEENNERQN